MFLQWFMGFHSINVYVIFPLCFYSHKYVITIASESIIVLDKRNSNTLIVKRNSCTSTLIVMETNLLLLHDSQMLFKTVGEPIKNSDACHYLSFSICVCAQALYWWLSVSCSGLMQGLPLKYRSTYVKQDTM